MEITLAELNGAIGVGRIRKSQLNMGIGL